MGRTPRWIVSPIKDGVATVDISSWRYFSTYIQDEMLNYRTYIWRGQKDENWKLETTLDRLLRKRKRLHVSNIRKNHLENFIYATRGRRGNNPPIIKQDNDWWALGQHHGLATPLLDWTKSPYVAAYFAFWEESNSDIQKRAVYAISQAAINEINEKLHKEKKIEIVKPCSDENPRLVNQGGLFLRLPDGKDLESWVRDNFKGNNREYVLMKLTLPDKDRDVCLRSLNRMNINHLSLFPDLYGACRYSNLELEIKIY